MKNIFIIMSFLFISVYIDISAELYVPLGYKHILEASFSCIGSLISTWLYIISPKSRALWTNSCVSGLAPVAQKKTHTFYWSRENEI